jgi:hypothetical protein
MYGLTGFFIAHRGNRAGVDHVRVRGFVKTRKLVSPRHKLALDGLGFKLIYLAAKGIYRNLHAVSMLLNVTGLGIPPAGDEQKTRTHPVAIDFCRV